MHRRIVLKDAKFLQFLFAKQTIFVKQNNLLSAKLISSSQACLSPAASKTSEPEYDVIVIGGGIVGTASARQLLLKHPSMKIGILEKENKMAYHQSGHNSGVIHAGIYYKPGSLKAKLCVAGLHKSYEYCNKEDIPYKKCGKLIVATDISEIKTLKELEQRALLNNVPDIKLINAEDISKYEPFCKGVKALWSPMTGIVDWELVTQHYAKNFKDQGGDIHLTFEVDEFTLATEGQSESKKGNKYPIRVHGKNGKTVRCSYVLTCAGLHSDRLAELSGCSGDPHIVPFRGEYLLLNPDKCHYINGNIYPVPDTRFPFLGVHFTPRMNGDVWVGPNAILAMKREGYGWSDIDFKDFLHSVKYRGFQRLALKFITVGVKEITCSLFPSLQVKTLQKYIPDITSSDLSRGPTGVRAQAMNNDGSLVEDFVFQKDMNSDVGKRILHCRNAPSPAATSSLAIAEMITDKFLEEFGI